MLGSFFPEPALSALGDTVHTLARGELKKSSLILPVVLGIGLGIVVGLMKIRYGLSLTMNLIVAHIIAFALTAVSEEAITCVARDSAGVTTGEATVHIILACASFGPIITALASQGAAAGALTVVPQWTALLSLILRSIVPDWTVLSRLRLRICNIGIDRVLEVIELRSAGMVWTLSLLSRVSYVLSTPPARRGENDTLDAACE